MCHMVLCSRLWKGLLGLQTLYDWVLQWLHRPGFELHSVPYEHEKLRRIYRVLQNATSLH